MAKEMNDEIMRHYATILKNIMPEGYGFSLIVFRTSDHPKMPVGKYFYISNAKRQSMIESLEAVLEKWKSNN